MKLMSTTLVATVVLATQALAAYNADVAFVVDQSGSMRGEFQWIGNSISAVDAEFSSQGITSNWGVAGYEEDAGYAYGANAWQDLSSDVNDVVNEVNGVGTYGGTERHYHAADWAADNFSWSGSDYAKVMILITDEYGNSLSSYNYAGLNGEAALGRKMADNDILLNVITFNRYHHLWDEAAYSVTDNPSTPEDETYAGLFDLNYLRSNPTGFTADFTEAKLREIKEYAVPEPATAAMFGLSLVGLLGAGYGKRKKD